MNVLLLRDARNRLRMLESLFLALILISKKCISVRQESKTIFKSLKIAAKLDSNFA